MKLKTLNVIYVLRLVLGVIAALITALVIDLRVGDPLISGISIGILFYIITYYILKWRFLNKVEKPSKIFTMGIGAYFLTFILCWVLFITPFLAPPTAAFTVDPNPDQESLIVGDTITFDATASSDPDGIIAKWQWAFGDGQEGEGVTITHIYSSAGEYAVTLRVVDDNGIGSIVVVPLTVSVS
jgi:PKD repeat protein